MSLLPSHVSRTRPLHSIAAATPRTPTISTSRPFSFASLFSSSDSSARSKSTPKSSPSNPSATSSPSPASTSAIPTKPATEAGSVAASRTDTSPAQSTSPSSTKPHHKTPAELDEELRQKMSEMAGDGGASGVEYEDGVPVSMKRSVKNNMFRYI